MPHDPPNSALTPNSEGLRVLVLHLTNPASAEAHVLARLLQHTAPGTHVDVILNRRGRGIPDSAFACLTGHPRVSLHEIEVGLPVDPGAHPLLIGRLVRRSLHPILRRRLRRILATRSHDLVYTSQQRFDCHDGELLSQRAGIPQVVHVHYRPGTDLRPRVLRRLLTCDSVIAVSEYIRTALIEIGVPDTRITVIPNSLDAREETPESVVRSTVTIGQVGRMFAEKGFADTVEAFARLHAGMPHTRLLLIGDGPDRDALERRVRELGLSDVVTFAGWQRNPRRWLTQLDIFCHPSRHEPFGLAVLEAMAQRLPVVAYREGATPEIVRDGESGFLANPGDIGGLTASLEELAGSPALRHRFGEAGRRRVVDDFSPDSCGTMFSEALESAVALPPG